jgi:hypothetical protein
LDFLAFQIFSGSPELPVKAGAVLVGDVSFWTLGTLAYIKEVIGRSGVYGKITN